MPSRLPRLLTPLLAGLLVALVCGADVPSAIGGSKANDSRFRQPVALAISPDGSRLFVANRKSGSLSIVALKDGRVVSEHGIAKGLAGLASLPDGRLLAIDCEGERCWS